MNKFLGYIRVSTTRQGEQGVSLQQQREAITRHAQRSGFELVQWYEEQETAAKRGRPVFGRMLKDLQKGRARGVIIHKIDRSARNLKDWADLGELIDKGIEVHFANESLDLNSRGGRLSADIQAVVASDFIRNLREETKKGFYGRLKQGLLPMRPLWAIAISEAANPRNPTLRLRHWSDRCLSFTVPQGSASLNCCWKWNVWAYAGEAASPLRKMDCPNF
jgi:DNA invertase Pin-like site-specific DNA recombinase